MDQACLYVSDFGFSLVMGGPDGTLSGTESCLALGVHGFALVFAAWRRVGGGRRGRERCEDRILEFDITGDSVG